MSIDEKLKKGDYVLIKDGVESTERGAIKFRGDVLGTIKDITGENASVEVASERFSMTLTYRLIDLHKY
jgi:hypothetical protein